MNASRARGQKRTNQAGLTLLEVMAATAIMAMISILIYGTFDSLQRGKVAEAARVDRAHQGREAMSRMTRELQAAFLSMHAPLQPSLLTRVTAFIGHGSARSSRVDFASFSHRRTVHDAKESDQAEIGYFLVQDPKDSSKMDLVRREQTPIDTEPKSGGIVNVLAEDVELFELSYLDATTGKWTDRWDSTSQSGQPARLPYQVKIHLVLKGPKNDKNYTFMSKVVLPMQQPLSFGNPQ